MKQLNQYNLKQRYKVLQDPSKYHDFAYSKLKKKFQIETHLKKYYQNKSQILEKLNQSLSKKIHKLQKHQDSSNQPPTQPLTTRQKHKRTKSQIQLTDKDHLNPFQKKFQRCNRRKQIPIQWIKKKNFYQKDVMNIYKQNVFYKQNMLQKIKKIHNKYEYDESKNQEIDLTKYFDLRQIQTKISQIGAIKNQIEQSSRTAENTSNEQCQFIFYDQYQNKFI